MATTPKGDDPRLRDAVMRMARQVAKMRANPQSSRTIRPVTATLTPPVTGIPGVPMAPAPRRSRMS